MYDREKIDELYRRANEALEHPERRWPEVAHRGLLRLWEFPSFDAWTTWLLVDACRSSSGLPDDGPALRELTWDQNFDKRRFGDPLFGLQHGLSTAPTLRRRDIALTDQQNRQLVSGLSRLTLPLGARHRVIGVDGTGYGLEFGDYMTKVRLSWWGDQPAEWAPLHRWFWRKRKLIARLFP